LIPRDLIGLSAIILEVAQVRVQKKGNIDAPFQNLIPFSQWFEFSFRTQCRTGIECKVAPGRLYKIALLDSKRLYEKQFVHLQPQKNFRHKKIKTKWLQTTTDLRGYIFWDIKPCSLLNVNRRFEEHVAATFRVEE
jgi:hypothetical protein